MDIVIKSYNRAYLLDRVLFSVYKHVEGGLGRIIVLDDGTPKKYLDRIQDKYPDVVIKLSPNYAAKQAGKKFGAPVQFWRDEIQEVSDNFLLLEDDIWLVDDVNLDDIDNLMVINNVSFFKLRWWGNNKMISGNFESINNDLGLITNVKLPFASEMLVKNKFYSHSLMLKLHLMPRNYFIPMYSLYDVAGQVFNRDYYLYVWPKKQYNIQEMIQLGLAAQYFRENRQAKVGRTLYEYAATTFLTSSTGNIEKIGFDMDLLNLHLNQLWMLGEMDSLQNFPADFSLEYLEGLLSDEDVDENFLSNWVKWSTGWRNHFIDLGSELNRYNNTNELA